MSKGELAKRITPFTPLSRDILIVFYHPGRRNFISCSAILGLEDHRDTAVPLGSNSCFGAVLEYTQS